MILLKSQVDIELKQVFFPTSFKANNIAFLVVSINVVVMPMKMRHLSILLQGAWLAMTSAALLLD